MNKSINAFETQPQASNSGNRYARFVFSLCFAEEGSYDVVGFDIELYSDNILYRLIDCMSSCVDQDWNLIPLCRARFTRSGHLVLSRAHRKYRFPLTGHNSGGNMYWEQFITKAKYSAHIINWLRRTPHCEAEQWDCAFMDSIWKRRQPLNYQTLLTFVREYLK